MAQAAEFVLFLTQGPLAVSEYLLDVFFFVFSLNCVPVGVKLRLVFPGLFRILGSTAMVMLKVA